MRESNNKSITQNRAAVSITTNLYDRRALDATCDRPLVNSLNHLTFLTSSSAKVRETLASDGGLERLVSILYECRKEDADMDYVLERQAKGVDKSIAEEKRDALIAWKWTLAFQCLVLIGTRGTEKIRERVVQAGIIPIIATVLDNYLLATRDFDSRTDTTLSDRFIDLVQRQLQILQRRGKQACAERLNDDEDLSTFVDSNSELHSLLGSVRNEHGSGGNNEQDVEVMHNISDITAQQTLHDVNNTITSPRFFLRGILVPKDDDVVWSLQLLAFISKYSYLKSNLQHTHLVESISLRSLLKNCHSPASIPALDKDDDLEIELISNLSSDENEQQQQPKSQHSTQFTQNSSQITSQNTSSASSSQRLEPQTQPNSENSIPLTSSEDVHIHMTNCSNEELVAANPKDPQLIHSGEFGYLLHDYTSSSSPKFGEDDDPCCSTSRTPSNVSSSSKSSCITKSLLKSILKFEKCCKRCSFKDETSAVNNIQDYTSNEEKTLNFIELGCKLNNFYSKRCIASKISSIKRSIFEKDEYLQKWDYDTYFLTHSPEDDCQTKENCIEELNIFPLVEKFTVKTVNTSDICYWAGVTMRNSCRKAESGVRQCACFDCGKWETTPRQFAKCRRCKRTKYCSKECQLKAWVYHKHWCVDSNSTSTSGHSHGTTSSTVTTTTTANVTGQESGDSPAVGTTQLPRDDDTTVPMTTATATTRLNENL
ncbi:MUB1 [Cyberlindnera jadinii]|uniref:MUB1 protein n=1 Tax=Cyberlindnera jadinii (strain ATCC 18201 / CBS 1600 / BCRC 20928 / JCM 3617 / NBRC 0987 / NRRL Y-1542) TaxID=983966 RepID=A0A0H5CBN2_CYBJN|nr:MUB1 [Cyberlindnera jadinii]